MWTAEPSAPLLRVAAHGVLTSILDVALTTVVSIGCNPANSAPPALTDLMTVLVGVIDKLSDYRTGSEFSFEEDELAKRLERSTLIDMWDILNAKAFHVLNRGLRIAGYVPPPALLDDCVNLLGALMAPVDYDMGPRQSGSEVEARAWAQTLRLAATLLEVGTDDATARPIWDEVFSAYAVTSTPYRMALVSKGVAYPGGVSIEGKGALKAEA